MSEPQRSPFNQLLKQLLQDLEERSENNNITQEYNDYFFNQVGNIAIESGYNDVEGFQRDMKSLVNDYFDHLQADDRLNDDLETDEQKRQAISKILKFITSTLGEYLERIATEN